MEIIIASIIAAGIGVWVYLDARARGINGIPWALLTFLLMIVGLPLYLFYRPKGKLQDCQFCGKKKLESLEVCPFCNNTGTVSSAEKPFFNVQDDTRIKQDKKICNSCGKIINSDWKFCPYCGSKQE